jgi:drug/metabolite transporter (DMT)-like permease
MMTNTGSLYILFAIFLWSSLGVVVRLTDADIHVLIFYSLVVAVVVQGILLSRKKYRDEMPGVRKLHYPLILGIISFINTFSFYYAFRHTTIANSVLTHYTAPIIVAFLAPFFLSENITRRIVLVIVLASAGLWIMLDGFSFQGSHTAGIMAGLVSGFAYAMVVLFARKYVRDFNPLVLSFFTNIFIAIMLLPFIREIPMKAIWICLFMGIVHNTIAPVLYYKGLQTVTANRAAVLGYLEPVCAIIFSMIFLSEIPGIHSLAGGVLIIFSGYLTVREPSPPHTFG